MGLWCAAGGNRRWAPRGGWGQACVSEHGLSVLPQVLLPFWLLALLVLHCELRPGHHPACPDEVVVPCAGSVASRAPWAPGQALLQSICSEGLEVSRPAT